MSLSRVVSVVCDNCGWSEHTADSSAARRREAGWHMCTNGDGQRRDFCPRCGCTGCGSMPLSNGDDEAQGWKPGDPCAACGSRATSYDHDTGAHCGSCGRSDSDE